MAATACALLLAGCAKTTVVRSPSASRSPPTPAATPRPATGATATVRKGDTLYRIAKEHGVSALDLAMWNRIAPPYTIHPGQVLRLSAPPTAQAATSTRPAAGTPAAPASGKPAQAGNSATPSTPAATPAAPTTKPPATAPARPATPVPATVPPPVAGFAWRWPAEGTIVGGFVAGDPTRQGIDIAGNSGAPVRAAADGVVVYSGAGLVGYGELIIIKHSEQWLSAYGHNRARLVNEGQRVKAGDQIAEMGRSGASRDMLHFEIRYNGKPQDPLQALPKR
ncbi:MAG: peptidoglycan DD-metalloendopeptidase family protein [Lysobacter sp.]|nr:peptidoglycan DD-metalloendopeptidase family protein [Lysobacter sp.]